MDIDATLSSFSPLIAKASVAFGVDFRYAEAIAKQAGAFARSTADSRVQVLAA